MAAAEFGHVAPAQRKATIGECRRTKHIELTMKFDVILADVPWQFRVWNKDTGHGRTAEAHYPTMSLDQICALPVADLAAPNAALFFWGVWPSIFDAQTVIEAWGFTYKTLAFEWIKLNKRWDTKFLPMLSHTGYDLLYKLFFMGMGYYTRANPEPCLLAIKGKMPVAVRNERNLLIAPIRKHSQKPQEQYEKIERLYPNGRYLELFARHAQPGWVSWGNEAETHNGPLSNLIAPNGGILNGNRQNTIRMATINKM